MIHVGCRTFRSHLILDLKHLDRPEKFISFMYMAANVLPLSLLIVHACMRACVCVRGSVWVCWFMLLMNHLPLTL